MITKRQQDGRRAKAATGRHFAGQYHYGYEGAEKGRARDASPSADEQAAVARIVELRPAGESYRSIAETLDAMAVRAVTRRELGATQVAG